MSLLRSRLQDFYYRVASEDMATLFSKKAKINQLEVSIVLQNVQVISPDLKYKAACILEILTGQRPALAQVDVKDEFLLDDAELKSPQVIRNIMQHSKKGLTTDDLKMLTDSKGVRLWCNLNKVNMFTFLEKAREFYLPDLITVDCGERKNPHDNDNSSSEELASYFKERANFTIDNTKKPRKPVEPNSNPNVASAAYIMKSSDLLKFPDIELYFEDLGTVFNSEDALQLYIRPEVKLSNLFEDKFPEHYSNLGRVDNLKVMNYFLSLYFNPYSTRTHQ